VGVREGREISADLAALGGLGLTGPGAPAAARAILAALLARSLPGSPHGPAEIILPAAAAPLLLPGYRHGDLAGLPGLTLAPSPAAALATAEELILRRTRLLDREPDETCPPLPPAMLLAAPDRPAVPRLAAIAQAGCAARVTVIVLGDWAAGAACHLTADGTASSTDPRLDGTRLFHLTPADTTAILTLLRQACGQPPVPAPPANPRQPQPAPALVPGPSPTRAGPGAAAAAPAARPASAAAGSSVVRVDVLGPLRITSRGTEITGGLRKARELIAFLAVHPAGATSEAISEALWPAAAPDRAAGQRNLALRKARDMLRAATGLTAAMWVLHAAGRYRLDPARVSTDLEQFTGALDRARHAAGDPGRLAACREAARLYRGELAEGAGYDWAGPHAETMRRRALDAWTTIAGLLAPRDIEQALAALESALGHDPYNEFLYQKIMRLQAAAGQPDAARRTLQLLETRLAGLGLAPGAAMRQAAGAILGPPGPPAPV
jgi:DNA-binding SARP family transcriptional activator